MSNASIRFAAIDPSLQNWGMAKFEFWPESGKIVLFDLKLIETEADKAKNIRVNSNDLRRANELFVASVAWLRDCTLFAAEIPSGTQSARGAMSNGLCIGLLGALKELRPLIQVQIAEAKRVATGRKTGSKEEMIDFATRRFPDAPWLTRRLKGQIVPIAANEHLADAACIGLAGIETAEFKQAIAIRQSMQRSAA